MKKYKIPEKKSPLKTTIEINGIEYQRISKSEAKKYKHWLKTEIGKCQVPNCENNGFFHHHPYGLGTRSDASGILLCHYHHDYQSNHGIHHDKEKFFTECMSEEDVLIQCEENWSGWNLSGEWME